MASSLQGGYLMPLNASLLILCHEIVFVYTVSATVFDCNSGFCCETSGMDSCRSIVGLFESTARSWEGFARFGGWRPTSKGGPDSLIPMICDKKSSKCYEYT